MSTLPSKFLVVVVVLLSVYQPSAAKVQFVSKSTTGSKVLAGKDPKVILETCKRTRHYNQCVACLQADLRSYDATDAAGLTKLALEHALANANHLYKQTNALRKRTGYDTKTIRAMETRSKVYGDAIDALTQATQAISSNDYKTANLYAGEAIDAADTCSQVFRESARTMPLARRNGILNELTVIALDLVALL